ncbi:MAG: Divalent-cation tolerance protein CutA [Methanomassiliicoccales archaeon PtaB.Bin134]|nr:MAG: Divalent-cation tolerance protein CutA [Methanomassiliicoccales archaeon PtaB.Bin134]
MYSSVLVTAPDQATAERLGMDTVGRGLAACVNMWPISSIYRWKGDLMQEAETALLFKVPDSGFEALSEAVLELHPYEVPCIVRYAIAEGHRPYLDWIGENVFSDNVNRR